MKRQYDRTDWKIIELLQKNARLSNKVLAAEVGLAPSSCFERVRRLEEAGVFLGYHADVDLKALGSPIQAMVAVRVSKHGSTVIEGFTRHALSLPEVRAVYHVSGVNDFLLHIVVKDSNHLRDIVLKEISNREEISYVETALIFDYERNTKIPFYEDGEGTKS